MKGLRRFFCKMFAGENLGRPARKRDVCTAAALVTFILFLDVMVLRRVYPFGGNCILRTDLFHQYAPFYSELRHKLLSGESLSFTWDSGLGANFASLYAYYLASPVNWLVMLVPENLLIEFITALIVLKTVLAAVSMTFYLASSCGEVRLHSAGLGILYALSGYMTAYSWNVHWLDCIWLFPLVCLALQRLVCDGKLLYYTVTLFLSILCNFYISIMVCFFLVPYFAAVVFMRRLGIRETARAGVRFAFASLLSAGMASAVLFPAVYALSGTASGNFSFPKEVKVFFSLFQVLARHMAGIFPESGLTHEAWPNIYCGVAVFPAMVLYALNKKIPLREKAAYAGMCLLFYLGFAVNTVNYVWHGFHFPNSLPARMSFMYIFIVLCVCCRVLGTEDGNTERDLRCAFFVSAGFIVLCQELVPPVQKVFTPGVFLITSVFLCLYCFVIRRETSGRWHKETAGLILFTLLSVEAGLNFVSTGVLVAARSSYTEHDRDVRLLTGRTDGDSFRRFRNLDAKTRNDGAWNTYPSLSLFSSTAGEGVTNFLKGLGTDSSLNSYNDSGATPMVDSLMGIGYTLSVSDLPEQHYENVGSSGKMSLYRNPDCLPIGFILPEEAAEGFQYDNGDAAEAQNSLSSSLGASPLLIRNVGKSDGQIFTFTAAEDGNYFVLPDYMTIHSAVIEAPSGTRIITLRKRRFFLPAGFLKKGEQVKVTARDEDGGFVPFPAKAYRFDYGSLSSVVSVLGKEPLEVTGVSDTSICGTVSTCGGLLFLSIPYDRGWCVMVDGARCSPEKVFDAFMGIRLLPGDHLVELRYSAPGRKEGITVSLASVFAFAVLAAWEMKLQRWNKSRVNELSCEEGLNERI